MSIIFHGIGNNGSPYIKNISIVDSEIIITYNDESVKSFITYSHPNIAGYKHIPAGGSVDQILRWSEDGTAIWGDEKDTIYVHPKSEVKAGIYRSVTVDDYGHVVAGTNPTTLEGYGITDAAAKVHEHNYASSATPGGSAISAVKLDTATAGSVIKPVYFSDGKPVACTYTLEKSVPADAVFTDTTYTVFKGATSSAAGSLGLVPAPAIGDQLKFLCADGTWMIPIDTIYEHPTTTAYSSGLYKFTTNNLGHVINAIEVTKQDIVNLGIPETDTTYTVGTETYSGTTKLYTATGSAVDGTMTQGAITTALNGKSPLEHTHNYAGSNSAGGAATSAIKLEAAKNITIGNATKSFDGTENISWTLDELGINTKSDIDSCYVMIGGTALSSSATTTDSAAQYKVISKSTATTGDIFSKSVTLPKGLYSVMVRMKVSAITSTASIFKLTIVDGSTTTTKYIKPSMFKTANGYTTLGTAVENTSGTLKVTLSISTALASQTACVDYLAITPAMVGVTSIA